jgi:exonuclease III
MGLGIMQWNCNKSTFGEARPTLERVEAKTFQVVALQEHSAAAKTGARLFCPPNFIQATVIQEGSKVAFLVYDKLPLNSWTIHGYGEYVERLRLKTDIGWLNVINVYNPGGDDNQPQIATWRSVKTAIRESGEEEVLLLGDFNIHHPAWQPGRARTDSGDHLLRRTGEAGLQLITEPGVATWERQTQATVIDLTFASYNVTQRITTCRPRQDWKIGNDDHIPIEITVDTSPALKPVEGRYNVKKANWEKIVEEYDASTWVHEDPEEALKRLQKEMRRLLKAHCPRTKASDRARSDWSPKAKEILQQIRAAKSRRRRNHLIEDEREWKHQANRLKRELARVRRDN